MKHCVFSDSWQQQTNRNNIILIGFKETPNKNTLKLVKDFFYKQSKNKL